MSKNDGYTTRNLFDYLYYKNHYKLIDINLSSQKNMNILQQINFTWKLEDDGTTMFFIAEKQQQK